MPPRKKELTPNVKALGITLARLKDAGRIEDVDSARVQALISMAECLDLDSSNAALWRQYREALRELTANDSGPLDDGLEDLLSPPLDETSG